MMSVTDSFPIIAGPTILVLGGLALSRGRGEGARRLFFVTCVFLGIWSIALFQMLQAPLASSAALWSKVLAVWPLAFAAMLHLAHLIARSSRYRSSEPPSLPRRARVGVAVLVAIYLPAAILAVLDLATGLVRRAPARIGGRWDFGLLAAGGGVAAVAWVAVVGGVSIALLVHRYFRASGSRARRLMLLTAGGLAIGWLGFLVIDALLPALGFDHPELLSVAFLAQVLVTKAALRWYGASIVALATTSEGSDRLQVREIHHRVKNSLAMISSLIDLHQLDSEEGSDHTLLEELKARLRSIALVHEKLYRGNANKVDFGEYARELLDNVISSFKPEGTEVELCVDIELVRLSADIVVPLGLILTELATNAVKYGFGEGRSVRIRLEMRCAHSHCRLVFSNSGSPMPLDVDAGDSSLGLRLVWALVDQISGSIELVCEPETRFIIAFPAEE